MLIQSKIQDPLSLIVDSPSSTMDSGMKSCRQLIEISGKKLLELKDTFVMLPFGYLDWIIE
jgi:hypothetical protein